MAGSGVPDVLVYRAVSELGLKEFTHGYGQTETSPVITMSAAFDPLEKKAKTVGKAMPHVELKIVNPENGKIVPLGEPGEICGRGYAVMTGYYNDKAKTEETIDKQGWIHTGDLGQFDDDGFIKIIGRSKDMIIRGGENIYPKELEDFLMRHPNISDV